MLSLQKGFTLIELLSVLGIVSILSAVAYPQYQMYIRKGRQLEAKTNLGVVYQKQLTYLSSELKFSPSLKTIGAVPKGKIRYNIGTDWDVVRGTPEYKESILSRGRGDETTTLCPLHTDQRGRNVPTYECYLDPHPEGGSGRYCQGYQLTNTRYKMNRMLRGQGVLAQSEYLGGVPGAPDPDNPNTNRGFSVTGGKFQYYAVGCTGLRHDMRIMDIWMMDHRKNLKNVKKDF